MDFKALISAETYADSEPVGIGAIEALRLPGPLPYDSFSYIPEPLWQRILSLGTAYSLHFSQIAEPIIDTVLDQTQCQWFESELEFLSRTVVDPAAIEAIRTVLNVVSRVAHAPSLRLVISPP